MGVLCLLTEDAQLLCIFNDVDSLTQDGPVSLGTLLPCSRASTAPPTNSKHTHHHTHKSLHSPLASSPPPCQRPNIKHRTYQERSPATPRQRESRLGEASTCQDETANHHSPAILVNTRKTCDHTTGARGGEGGGGAGGKGEEAEEEAEGEAGGARDEWEGGGSGQGNVEAEAGDYDSHRPPPILITNMTQSRSLVSRWDSAVCKLERFSHTLAHTHTHKHTYTHTQCLQDTEVLSHSTHTRTRTCTHTHVRIHALVHTDMHVCVCECICVCLSVVCVYIYQIHTRIYMWIMCTYHTHARTRTACVYVCVTGSRAAFMCCIMMSFLAAGFRVEM
jgi:hypothetical protein